MTTNVADTLLCIGMNVVLSIAVLLIRDCVIDSVPKSWRHRRSMWVIACLLVILLVVMVWVLSGSGMMDRRNILVY